MPTRRVTEPADDHLMRRVSDLLASGDVLGLTSLVGGLIDRGWSAEQVVDDLVVPSQRAIGAAWYDGAATVADEHERTAVWDQVLHVVDQRATGPRHLPSLDTRAAPTTPTGHDVAVVCAEGEWHVLAARLAALRLRWAGHRVHWFGGPVPAAHLTSWLRAHPIDAVVVSCTMTARLPGARWTIAASHQAGRPVLVGGAAVTAERARRLGAECGGHDAATLTQHLEEVVGDRSAPTAPTETGMASPDLAPGGEGRRRALRTALAVAGELGRDGGHSILGDPSWPSDVIDVVAAADLVDEPTLVEEHVAWMAGALASEGVEPFLLRRLLSAMAHALGPAGAVLHRAAALTE